MKTIAIFASGEGTNAENLIEYFSTRNDVNVEGYEFGPQIENIPIAI